MRHEELVLNVDELPTQDVGPERLMLAVSQENTQTTSTQSGTLTPPQFSSAGLTLPTDVYTIPYAQINAPFEAALQQYLSEDPKTLLKSIQNVSKSSNYKSYDFFKVKWEELFKIPVDEEHDKAIRITQDVKEGGVDSLPRVLAVNGELQPRDVVFIARVTSQERELETEAELGNPPEEPPIIIPPPPEGGGTFTVSDQSAMLSGCMAGPFPGNNKSASGDLYTEGRTIVKVSINGTDIDFDTPSSLISGVNDQITISGNVTFDYFWQVGGIPNGDIDFSFELTDGNGNVSLPAILTIGFYDPGCGPVVLDLTGEGINLLSPEISNVTVGDIDETSDSSAIGWIAPGNAILMLDSNGDGSITDLNQIAFTDYTPGAKTDLEGLASFDTNGNGFLDPDDESYDQFGVLSAEFEYTSLAELGIVSLSLTSDHNGEVLDGNYIHGYTTYNTDDGQTHIAADIVLSIASEEPLTITVGDIIWDDALDAQLSDDSSSQPMSSALTEIMVVVPPVPLEALEPIVPVQQEIIV